MTTMHLVPMPIPWRCASKPKRRELGGRATGKRNTLLGRDGRQCFYCQRPLLGDQPATLDHVIPYAVVRSWNNKLLVLACLDCNQAKGDKIPAVFMPALSALVYRLATLNAAAVKAVAA